ncbi:serine/threonine-protein kinase pim-1-like [Melanotaenia boesemani]|uniref:serine/threonine-protein kinase pim-1-like n=1 Tax=Melanotaenia boesemani TaxID=1250792 RepID=UPI001C04046F|nr:serine/threonine-protein kinase pim-1-like [Melanotaenia boesemani]
MQINKEGCTAAFKKDQEENRTMIHSGPVSGQVRRTKPMKRKSSLHHQIPAKMPRLSEVDGPSSISQNEVNKGNSKRKRDEEEGPSSCPKKTKVLLDHVLCNDKASSSKNSSCSNINERPKISEVSHKTLAFSKEEAPSRKTAKKALWFSPAEVAQRAEFEAKYTEENHLGSGGYGSVFAGYRKADNLPVAIKHIPKDIVLYEFTDEYGNGLTAEVVIMEKLKAATTGSVGKSAPVALLDWYNLEQELVLVLERPVSAVDLFQYVGEYGGRLQEDEAKVIIKQLLDAAIYLQENHIFHRDIKLENILVETDSDIPRLRLIDFGLSCFYEENTKFNFFEGTMDHIPPEALRWEIYSAGPSTVWQVGVVLFETLHKVNFLSTSFIKKRIRIRKMLSKNCQDFLRKCLTQDPEERPTLKDLQSHAWLM